MRTVRLAIIAFLIGFAAVAGGVSQVHFLWSAYHHGGL